MGQVFSVALRAYNCYTECMKDAAILLACMGRAVRLHQIASDSKRSFMIKARTRGLIFLVSLIIIISSRGVVAGGIGGVLDHFGNDLKFTYGYWPGLIALGGAIAAAELTEVDHRVSAHYRGGGNLGKFDKVAGYVGDFYVVDSVALLLFGISKLAHADKPALTGEAMLEALALTETSTAALKLAFRRGRPDGGKYSFPSGHVARCFAAASVLETMHGPMAGIPAFLAASAISFSRIDSNAHYLSDVAFGAAWGAAIGWGTAWFHKKSIKRLTISPMTDGTGIAISYRF